MSSRRPFFRTWSRQRDARIFDLVGAQGVRLQDARGDEWLDLGSLSYQAHLGFGHPAMVAAIREQAQTLCLAPPNADYPGKSALADELLAMAPEGFSRVFFTLGGAEAVENALKIARLFSGRYKVVSRYRSYHGATLGALSVTGDYRRPPLEPTAVGATRILDCYCDRCPFGKTVESCSRECAHQLGDVLALEGNVGAAIFEPVPGANGVLIPPADYWLILKEECDRHRAVLIADEVLTGFGRTGRGLAIDHWGVVPDLICLAKGLTAGYGALGAVLVHERIDAHFDDEVLYAGLTGYAHPLGVAAARAALEVYESEDLYARAASLEPVLRQGLEAVAAAAGAGPVRCIGLLGAVELSGDASAMASLQHELDQRRVLAHVYPSRGTLVVAPALTIAEDELREGLEQVTDAARVAAST